MSDPSPRLALFDLDGTLTDNSEGIVRGTEIGLDAVGVTGVSTDDIRSQIGPPLRSMFAGWGLSPDEVERAVVAYREYYRATGVLENRVYDGVREAIAALVDAGLRLAVATSKPETFAVQILEHFELAHHFGCIAGATLDGSREAKSDIISHALSLLGHHGDDTVMIGDRRHDIEGAALASVPSTVGVLWGFGSLEELSAAGAEHVVATPAELVTVLLQHP